MDLGEKMRNRCKVIITKVTKNIARKIRDTDKSYKVTMWTHICETELQWARYPYIKHNYNHLEVVYSLMNIQEI